MARPTDGKMATNTSPNLHICVYLCSHIFVDMMPIHTNDNIKTNATKGNICIYTYANVYLYTCLCEKKNYTHVHICVYMLANIAVCTKGKMASNERTKVV